MHRAVALLVLLLGALATLTTVDAYEIARPMNALTVSVSSYDSAQISVSPGSNGTYLAWVQGAGGGSVTLDLTRGAGTSTGYAFATNATYTAYRVLRITNNSGTAKNVTVNHGSGIVTVVSGYVYPGGALSSGTTYTVQGNGGYVDLNLRITTGVNSGTLNYTVTAN